MIILPIYEKIVKCVNWYGMQTVEAMELMDHNKNQGLGQGKEGCVPVEEAHRGRSVDNLEATA